jgi:hypothetical protein
MAFTSSALRPKPNDQPVMPEEKFARFAVTPSIDLRDTSMPLRTAVEVWMARTPTMEMPRPTTMARAPTRGSPDRLRPYQAIQVSQAPHRAIRILTGFVPLDQTPRA